MKRSGLTLLVGLLVVVLAVGGLSYYKGWGPFDKKHEVLKADAGPSPFKEDPEPGDVTASKRVGPRGGTFAVGGISVAVPAGAVAKGQTITVKAHEEIGEENAEVFGQPLTVDHAAPLAKPLTVSWPTKGFSETQLKSLVLTKWNEDSRAWEVQNLPLTVKHGQITVNIQSFSTYDVAVNIGQQVGEWTGSRTDPPRCSNGSLPSWVEGTVSPSESTGAAALLVCFEPDKDDVVTARMANNRTFSQEVTMTSGGQKWAWTWPGDESYGVSDAIYSVAHSVFDNDTTYFIPPLATVAVGIDRPSSPGDVNIQATGKVNLVTVFVDLTSFIFDQLPVGGTDNPLLDPFLQTGYDCGGKALLGHKASSDMKENVSTAIKTIASCFGGISDPDSPVGREFEKLARQVIANSATKDSADKIAQAYRVLDEASKAMKLLTIGEVAFYFSDQLANAMVGPLSWSIRGRGQPQVLGAWKPTCKTTKTDSNALYKNLALQDAFADTSKELWQFSDWTPDASVAVQPLATCSESYLKRLADYLPKSWGEPKAAGVVADAIRALYAPRQTAPPSTPSTTQPPQTHAPARSYTPGSAFDDYCVINWPTAPSYTRTSIQMVMGCRHVDQSKFFYTLVLYGDPNLPVTPSTGEMHVVGQVIDTAHSAYGYNVLEVQASKITIGG